MKKILTLFTALIVLGSMMVVKADITVFVKVPTEWTKTIHVYIWGPSDVDDNYDPVPMTHIGNGQWWSYTYTGTGTEFSAMILNGKDAINDKDRSCDITDISANTCYELTYHSNNRATATELVYTVAGEPTAVFGGSNTWDPSNVANQMVVQPNGTFKYVKENLNATSAAFKVVKGTAWGTEYPTNNYEISFTTGSTLVITFNPDGNAVDAYTYIPGMYVGAHGSMTSSGWETVAFTPAANNETASYTYENLTAGNYSFGMRIGANDNWTSNGVSFTRSDDGKAKKIVAGSGNCSFNADYDGDYTFTYTYATRTLTITYPPVPAKSVDFDGLGTQILKGTEVNFSATSTGVNNAGYRYYVKPANGDYGDALTSYTFNTNGEYVVKVDALENNTGEPVVSNTANITVYENYAFTAGTRIYVDFSAMTEGAKGVNYPSQNTNSELDYDDNGAGTTKIVLISQNVTWSTLDDFIKTEKNGWAGLKFTAPGEGQNKIIVAADGASYTWGTHATAHVKFFAPRTVDNPWTTVYAYAWDDAGDFSSAWPGDNISSTKNNGWYEYNLPIGAKVIFSDGDGSGHMQTENIENITADVCYVPTAVDNDASPKLVTVATDANCEVDYYISGTKELTGLESDWVAADANFKLDANLQIVFPNLAAGTYEFKITNGTWAWSIGGNSHLKSGECSSIAATAGIGNVAFAIDHTQDVTITYYPESEEICLGAETVPTTPIEEIGGKFIINAKGDTAIFSRGNLQYQQSSNTWRCAPNQYEWKGMSNLQMGNPSYEGWVDLFCWSLGAENNYGATSAYLTTNYVNKNFVDWGGLFSGEWSTLSSAEWSYVLNTRSGANDKWGMAMIGDTIGMILLPDEWTAPAGITFVPRTNPTSELWDDDDAIDNTGDHYRVKKENMPANKFTIPEWEAMEAAGAVFLPYAGRRSGGYGNHTNRNDETVTAEYNYTYYENYLGTYWTSTLHNATLGQADYVYTFKHQKINNEDDYQWGKAVIWSENGRYGQSVRLVHISPRQYTVTYDANGAEGTAPTDAAKYLDGAQVTLASADGLHKDGYVFAGWKYKDVTYNGTYTIANVLANEEIVFEAQWEKDWTEVRNELIAGSYYTMCLDKAVTAVQGGTIWRVLSKAQNGTDVILEEVTGNLDAGRPYIFFATANTLQVAYTGEAVGAPLTEGNNGLVGSFVQAQIENVNTNYIIYNNALYYVNSNNVYVGANRAYLNMLGVPDYSPAAPAPGIRRVHMAVHGEQVVTGVDQITNDQSPITNKVIIDGRLFILRGEKVYDATGRLVK